MIRRSESTKNLAKAMLVAQKETGAAKKESKNPFFKSNYADLPTVIEVIKQPYNDAGIFINQPSTHKDGKNFITTILTHADSGEWMEADTEVICGKVGDPQAFGAAQTYARRFALQAMLLIPAEDDDGNTAAGRTAPKVASKPAAEASPTPVAQKVATPVAATPAAPVTEVKPLARTSFRNKKTVQEAAAVVAASATSNPTQEGEWA